MCLIKGAFVGGKNFDIFSAPYSHLTLSLHACLNVTDDVSRPYETTGKTIVLYILIMIFLESD
jgi:hypothetical protein